MARMPHGQMTAMRAMLSSPSTSVARKKVPLCPLLMMALESSVLSGMKAPLTQSICMSRALASHRSVMASTINSRATMPKPRSKGKEMNAVKRMSLRMAASCRSLSLRRSTSTGCATCDTMFWTSEKHLKFHWYA